MSRQIRERIGLGFFTSLVCAGGVLAALGCSGDTGGEGSSVLDDGCRAEGGTGCVGSGAECEDARDCASGRCSAGQCAGEPAERPNGSGAGSAQGGAAFILTDDIAPAAGGAAGACVELDVAFSRVTPSVVLLIDRSGSMTQPFDGGRDRWQTLVQTLTDPDGSWIRRLEGSVRFGMALYSSNRGFGGGPTPRQCPILTSVDVAMANFASMSALLSDAANGPVGDTPTAESMAIVAAQLAALGEDGPKSIILATDGDPDTCDDPDSNNQEGSKASSVASVADAFARGISTHVISVGDEVTASHLQALAVAGAGGDPTAKAYTALDTAGLEAAFEEIIGSVRTCDFALEGKVDADQAARGSVLLDGEPLAFGDPNGWAMPDDRTVRLLGRACEALRDGASGIAMSFPCEAIEVGPPR